jgi:hypothetical protein
VAVVTVVSAVVVAAAAVDMAAAAVVGIREVEAAPKSASVAAVDPTLTLEFQVSQLQQAVQIIQHIVVTATLRFLIQLLVQWVQFILPVV